MSHEQAYRILQIVPTADKRAIRAAFRQRVLELHPDRHRGDCSYNQRLHEVISAYELLTHSSWSKGPRPNESSGCCRSRPAAPFSCPTCGDGFEFDVGAHCPRCAEARRGSGMQGSFDEWLEPIGRAGSSVQGLLWNRWLQPHAEQVVVLLLVCSGTLALQVNVPLASMALGYALFLSVRESSVLKQSLGR